MKVQILSDLHLEFEKDPIAVIESLKLHGIRVVVLAGDIMNVKEPLNHRLIAAISQMGRRVIWVFGNHEYYGSDVLTVNRLGRQIEATHSKRLKICFEPKILSINKQIFRCGTMWYNAAEIAKIGNTSEGTFNIAGRTYQFSDFRHIDDLAPWVYGQNFAFTEMVRQVDRNDIVITHHLPSPLSTPERFQGKIDNAFYVSDQTDVIRDRQPKLWIHGHTHSRFDYWIGDTRVVANPRGYSGEIASRGGYNQMILDIPTPERG